MGGGSQMMDFVNVKVNDQWDLLMPKIRADALPWHHWEYERLHAMYAAIRKGDTILDIGTEHGDMSALFAKWSGGATILVEPTPAYWPYIKSIFEKNGVKEPLFSFVGFASNETTPNISPIVGYPSEVNLPIKQEGDEGFGFSHINERPDIPQVKIDDLCKDRKIDIITMDIEGGEYFALQGMLETIKRDKPIVFISVHPEFMWDRYHFTIDDLLWQMKLLGYESVYLGRDHEKHFMFKPV